MGAAHLVAPPPAEHRSWESSMCGAKPVPANPGGAPQEKSAEASAVEAARDENPRETDAAHVLGRRVRGQWLSLQPDLIGRSAPTQLKKI